MIAVWTGYFLEIMTLFGLIIIHELGHVSAARFFNWRMTEIELLPFGGVAKTDEWGTVPSREELIVAVAGPAYNAIMIVFAAICDVFGWWSHEWADFFVTANLWLAAFNLLPIYPLDGGRILQVWMNYHFPFRRAVLYTLLISWTLTAALFVASFLPLWFGRPFLLNVFVIAIFLLISNLLLWRQKNYQYIRFLLGRQTDKNLTNKRVAALTVTVEDTIISAIKKWKKEVYHVIVVSDERGNVLRVLPEETVLWHFFNGSTPYGKFCELLDGPHRAI